jgi:hypothetical protein
LYVNLYRDKYVPCEAPTTEPVQIYKIVGKDMKPMLCEIEQRRVNICQGSEAVTTPAP